MKRGKTQPELDKALAALMKGDRVMKQYSIMATVNYLGDSAETPTTSADIAGVTAWVYALLTSEPEATSYQVVIVPQKEKGNG